jgi:hypothetical protein
MAQFRGTVRGARGEVSRLGHKNSGMTVEAQSWEGKVVVRLYRLETAGPDGQDWAEVTLGRHHGAGTDVVLYHGPVGGYDAQDGRVGPTRPMSNLSKRVTGERRRSYPCKYGHFDCAVIDGGHCHDEMMSRQGK